MFIEAPQSTPGRWKPTLCFNLHPFVRSWDTRLLSFLVAIPLLFFRFFVFPPSSFRLSSLLWPTIVALVMFALILSMGLVEFLLGMRYLHRRSQVLGAGPKLGSRKALAA